MRSFRIIHGELAALRGLAYHLLAIVVRRLAVVSRLSSTWIEASEAERADLLN